MSLTNHPQPKLHPLAPLQAVPWPADDATRLTCSTCGEQANLYPPRTMEETYPPELETYLAENIHLHPRTIALEAYQLGRRSIVSHAGKHRWSNSTPAQRAAVQPPAGGKPKGAKDTKPRTRRKKAEIEASRVP